MIIKCETDNRLINKHLNNIVFCQKFMLLIISFSSGFFATYYLIDKKWRIYNKNLG